MTDPQDARTGDGPRRGRWLRRGCGCFAFFFGAGVTFVAFAPLLFGRMALQAFVTDANEQIAGELELGDVAFSWTKTQRLEGLRLRDPEGRTVADFDVEVPSILHLLRAASAADAGEVADFGRWYGAAELALVTSPDEASNLERALEPAGGRQSAGASTEPGGGPGDGAGGDREVSVDFETPLGPIAVELLIDVKHFSWSDPRLDAGGRAVGVKDLQARLVLTPDAPAHFVLQGEHLYGSAHGPLAADFEFDPAVLVGKPDWTTDAKGSASIEAIPTALLDRLFEADGELIAALGDEFDLRFGLTPEPSGALGVRFGLASQLQDLGFDGRIADGMLSATDSAPQVWNLTVPRRVVDEALDGALPEGVVLALAEGAVPVRVELSRLRVPVDGEARWTEADLGVAARLPGFELRAADGETITMTDVLATVELAPEGPLDLGLALREASGARADAALRLPPGWESADEEAVRRGELAYELTASVRDLGAERLASIAPDLPLADLLERPLELDARIAPGAGSAMTVRLDAKSGSSFVRAGLTLADERFVITPREEVRAELVLDREALTALAGASLPEGLRFAQGTDPTRMECVVTELDWPLESVGTLEGRASLTGLALDGDSLAAAGERLAIETMTIDFAARADDPVAVDVDLALADAGGALTARARSTTTLREFESSPPAWTVHLEGSRLRTALLDALAQQDGLLVDVLGASLALTLDAREIMPDAGSVDLTLTSPGANVAFAGRIEDGVLVSAGEGQALDASVGVTPLFQERVVGKLVPMLVALEPTEDPTPAVVRVTDFRLPLAAEGDALSAISADVRLALGEVQCAVLPDLARYLSAHVHRLHTTQLPPIDLTIREGVVHLPELPIEIEKTPLVFAGDYALASEQMNLSCSVPLGSLRGEVGRAIEEAREYLDPTTSVPLRISGKPSRPSVGVEPDFLKTLLRDSGRKAAEKAAGDALEKGLRKLFGDD